MQLNVKNKSITVLLKEYCFEIKLLKLDIVSFTVIEEKYRTGNCDLHLRGNWIRFKLSHQRCAVRK